MTLKRPLYLASVGVTVAIIVVIIAVYSYAFQKDTPPLAVSISVSRTPLSSPFYIAEHQGFFRQAGVDIELHEELGGHRSFNAMVAGQSDLATSSDSVIMFNSFKRNDFSVLATFVQSDNDIKIIGKRKGGNLTARALENQKIAVIKGSSSEFFAHTYLLIEGINPASVITVNIDPEQMSNALKQDQITALVVWEPFAFKAMSQLQDNSLIYPTKGLYNLTFNLVAKRSYASK